MAKRRALARALAGLGEGIGNAGTYMFRQSQQERMQDRYDQRQAATQEAIDARAAKNAAAVADRADISRREGALLDAIKSMIGENPEPEQIAALADMLESGDLSTNAEGLRKPQRVRLEGSLGKSIDDAKSPEDVPSMESIFGVAESQGMGRKQGPPQADDPNAMELQPDPVKSIVGRAGARRRSLMEKPTNTVNVTTDSGAEETRFVSPYGGSVQTQPTSQRQGELAGTEEAAKQKGVLGDEALTALRGQTEGRIQAIVENLTRSAKVQTAAQTAGASKRATLAPDIIASEVDRNKQITAGKENSTEGERRAATNFTPLINAHVQALSQEANGVRIGTGDQTMTNIPLANRMVPAATQAYMQAARDFVSTMGLIRSGVAVPEAEVTRFMSSMFGTTGDDARTIKQKQASREVFIASLQSMVGRSADDAGRLLAGAINAGQIRPDILVTLKFEPDIERAMLANLKNVPKFDATGNPLVDARTLKPPQ